MPRDPPSGLVLTTTMTRSHICPFEMNVFWPEMTYSSPSRIARVRMPCRSLPVPGHCDGAYSCASDHARQPFLLLLLGAVVQQIAATDVAVDREVGRRA